MKLKETIPSFSIEDSNIIKGIGILLIAFHNFFHWIGPAAKENEFEYSIRGVNGLIDGIAKQPLESFHLALSFWGHFGVQLFIFISGYGLMKAYQNKNIKWGSFVSKRINKLWPTFFFGLFVFYSLFRAFYFHYGFEPFVLQLYFLKITFLSNFFPDQVFSLNGPWWFYSMIVQLYLVFPFLLKLQKKTGNISLILISILSYILLFLFNPWFVAHHSSLYFFFLGNIPVFSFGMILASKKQFTYHYIIGIIALILFAFSNFNINLWYFSHLLFTIVSIYIIYILFIKRKKRSYLYKTILFYGNISMYLFAIHGFFRVPFIKAAEESNNPLMTILYAFLFITFTSLVALLLKFVVDNYMKILYSISRKLKEIKSPKYHFLIKSSNSLFQLGTVFILVLIVLRIYEYILLNNHHDLSNIGLSALFNAISLDIIIGIGFIGIMLLPYIAIYSFSQKIAKTIFIILANIIIILSISLIQYYDITLIPLDRVVYAYSWESMMELSNTTAFDYTTILPYILTLIFFNASLFFTKHIKYKPLFIIITIFTSITLGLLHNKFLPHERNYDSEIVYYYSNNKLVYFIKDVIRYKPTKDLDLENIKNSNKSYRKVFSNRKYLSLSKPFLRKREIGNPLGPYFNKTKDGKKPNIVFIIVESLCPAVSGPYSDRTSFTPFLDSLTKQSLFWRNNLSTAERTFGVLPAIFGSQPYGKKGFLDYSKDMPPHKNLIKILNKNQYETRFFYGGYAAFDHMNTFMQLNEIDTFFNQFNPSDSIPPNENDFSWGYSDRAIFQSTFNNTPDSNQAYLSIYLTLSTHSPFMLKNQKYYMQRVMDRLKELGVPENKLDQYRKNQKKLSTFVFFDDELRNFFKEYRKRKDFKNTIFVITGDHRGIIFYRTSHIDVYHTPLIIYSPLLKKAQEFGGVTSHLDLTPTFVNFLENEYQLKVPQEVNWLGQLIDTSIDFHSSQKMAFMRNNRNIEDYIHGEYYLANDKLFKVHDLMKLEDIDKPKKKQQLKNELKDFKNLNLFYFMVDNLQDNVNIKEITNIEYNFDNKVIPFFKDDTTSENAFNGSRSLLLRKNQEYGSITPTIILEEGVSKVYIECTFKILVKEAGKHNPIFVSSVIKDGKNLDWEGTDFMTKDFGTTSNWRNIKVSKTLYIDKKNSKGSELKLYLWNTHGTIMYYDNIKVKIKVKQ